MKIKNFILEVTEDGRCPCCGEKIERGGWGENEKRRGMGRLSGGKKRLSRLFVRYLIPGRS